MVFSASCSELSRNYVGRTKSFFSLSDLELQPPAVLKTGRLVKDEAYLPDVGSRLRGNDMQRAFRVRSGRGCGSKGPGTGPDQKAPGTGPGANRGDFVHI